MSLRTFRMVGLRPVPVPYSDTEVQVVGTPRNHPRLACSVARHRNAFSEIRSLSAHCEDEPRILGGVFLLLCDFLSGLDAGASARPRPHARKPGGEGRGRRGSTAGLPPCASKGYDSLEQ